MSLSSHADCAREVRYAGEFHIQKPRAGVSEKYRLVIDNNSGTFGPDPNVLPKLAQVLKLNFPGLEVETLAFADPQLASYRKQLEEEKASVIAQLKNSGGALLKDNSARV
jgi:hypothetical protein